MTSEKRILIENIDLLSLFGYNDNLLNLIESRFLSSIVVRGSEVIIRGEKKEIDAIEKVFKELVYLIKKNGSISDKDVSTVIDLVDASGEIENAGGAPAAGKQLANVIYHGYKDIVRAKTPNQLDYYQKVSKNDLVFAIGPAGTGKTFLAVAMALAALKRNEVSRIILSRPAVEAGESLGFLPGDLNEKIDPYLRPLTDALQQMLGFEKYKILRERGIVEINPLAYMRGRTLNQSFIILDEAQNATQTQMKMFLTRLGTNSKAIVTGDITQIDLPNKSVSGLENARTILKNVAGIGFVQFDNTDVVRHKLVADIIKAYEKQEKRRAKSSDGTV